MTNKRDNQPLVVLTLKDALLGTLTTATFLFVAWAFMVMTP